MIPSTANNGKINSGAKANSGASSSVMMTSSSNKVSPVIIASSSSTGTIAQFADSSASVFS